MNITNNSDEQIYQLVVDYVRYHLRKNGYDWPQVASPLVFDSPPNKLNVAVRSLCDEFELRYNNVFFELCNQLHITPSTARTVFYDVVNELFCEGVKWGRVVALFTLAGALSAQCMRDEKQNLVNNIVEWTAIFIKTNLIHWIRDHNGWEGFIDFYEGHPEKRLESPWPTLKNFFCGVAAGALGALTISAILTSKT